MTSPLVSATAKAADQDEVVVTSEMVEAGEQALALHMEWELFNSIHGPSWVTDVYIAMERARRQLG